MLILDVFFPSETLEAERALIEERYEDKISNLQKHLKKFYSEELKVRVLTTDISQTFRLSQRPQVAACLRSL